MSSSTRRIRRRIAAGTFAGVLGVSGVAALAPAASAKDFVQAVNTAGNLAAANVGGTARLSGADRYATAAAVATATYPTGGRGDVLLASGLNYPDGLAGSGLAGFVDAPLLLTDQNTLPTPTVSALAALTAGNTAKRVHILGGTAAISQAVRDQLKGLGYTLVENYSGLDRYDTAAKVATAIGAGNIGAINGRRTAILVTGQNFADALAGGAVAFAGRIPILLTAPDALPLTTSAALTALGITQVLILGGTAAVSTNVQTALTTAIPGLTVVRLAGADRAETASLLANYANANLSGLGFNRTRAVLFNGYETFADGLSAGPHAGKIGANLLPVQAAAVPTATSAYLTANSATINIVQGIGGTAAIADTTLTAAVTAATIAAPTATILAGAGTPAFQVKFSSDVDATAGPNGATLLTNYQLLSATATLNSVTYNAATRTATVVVTGTLAANDTVRLTPNPTNPTLSNILAAGSTTVFVPFVTSTIAADVTAPVVTIRATSGGGNKVFTALSSKLLTVAPVVGSFSVTGTAGPVVSVTVDPNNPADYIVTTTNPIAVGDTITLAANAVTAGNGLKNAQVGPISAVGDTNPPSASASVVTSASGRDVLVVTGTGSSLLLTSTVPAGASGTSVTIVLGATPAPSVAVVGRAITISLGTTAGSNSPAAIQGLINGNGAAAALVTASNASGTADINVAAVQNLAGGTTTSQATITLSEAIKAGTLQIFRNGDVGDPSVGNLITVAVAAPTAGPIVLPTATSAGVVAGVARLRVNTDVVDLAGNFNAIAVNSLVTAG